MRTKGKEENYRVFPCELRFSLYFLQFVQQEGELMMEKRVQEEKFVENNTANYSRSNINKMSLSTL
jgi:hypothetical protein